MAQVMSCPDRDVLHRLMLGELTGQESDSLLLHLEQCPECSKVVSTFRSSDTLVDAARQPATVAEETGGEAVRSLVEQLRRRGPPSAAAASATPPSVDTPTLISGESCSFLHPPLQPGEIGRLGAYRVVKLLGGGAMGMVFQAEDIALKRRVALKVMKPELANRPTARERFLREARAAAALEHEHIVTIYQVGEERGVPFLAMQLLRGESLETRLKRAGRPGTDEILHLGRQIARGLAAAHAQGLIHRDIKPANLWLEPSAGEPGYEVAQPPRTRVKIVDFGLARAVEGEAQLTQSGTVLGTPAYMAPEQARGEKVDARCDLFSLGCVLYRMCTGRMPFPGDSMYSVLHALATHTPRPVSEFNPAVPPALGELVMQLLTKDPAGRPASAREVADRLQAIERQLAAPPATDSSQTEIIPATVSESAQPSTIVRPVRRRWLPVAAIAVLALLPLSYFFGGQVIRIATDKGQVVIEVDDPGVEVTVKEKGATIQDRAGQREITLVAGAHEIQVTIKDAAGTLELPTQQFTLSRGGKVVINVRQELAKANEKKTDDVTRAAAGTPTVRPTDPDRRAAEWVLSIGGKVWVRVGDKVHKVAETGKLPEGALELTNVDLSDSNSLTDSGLVHLQGRTNLKSLSLWHTKVSDAGLVHVQGMSNLTDLSLTGTRVTDAGMVHLKGLTKLTNLSLFQTKVGDAGLEHLKGLTHLTWLGLYGTQVGDAGLEHLKGLTNLRNLSLYGTRVSDAGMVHLKGMLSLTNLELRFTAVGNAGLTHVKGLTSLTSLDVSYTQVTDAGLEQLKGLTNLTYLNLNRIRLTDAGLAHLHGLTNLQNLHLTDTRVTSAGVAALQKALPKCTITWGADRSVAEWVLAKGGIVRIRTAKANQAEVKAAKDLPADDFQLVLVNFNGDSRFTDADLERLQGLPNLGNLHLRGGGFRVSDVGLARLKNLPALGLLEVQNSGVSDSGLKHLTALPRLDSLDLSGTRVTDGGLEHLKAVPRLAILRLSKTAVTDTGVAHLGGMKRLVKLDLTGTKVTPAAIAELQTALPNCTIFWDADRGAAEWVLANGGQVRIRSANRVTDIQAPVGLPTADYQLIAVNLIGNEQIADADLAHLQGLANLSDLTLQSTRISDVGLRHLKGLTSLSTLRLGFSRVRDGGLEHLKDLKNLTTLSLMRTGVTNAGLEHLTPLTKLTHLDLYLTGVGDDGLAHLKALSNLTSLRLAYNRAISDRGLGHLSALTNLKSLDLSITGVSDAGLEQLRALPGLTALSLNSTKVSDAGLKHLHTLTKLRELDLTGTIVSAAGIAELRKALPNCQVTWNGTHESERSAAKWVLANGGKAVLWVDSKEQVIQPGSELPTGNFRVVSIDLERNEQVNDEGLANLRGLLRLRALNLQGTRVGDAGMAHLATLPNLDKLSLHGTRVGDAGLEQLKRLSNLTDLALSVTRVSDAGLPHIKGLSKLTKLTLAGTRITDAGLVHLRALTNLNVLGINNNPVTDAGLVHLRGLPNLGHLYLHNTRVSDAGLAHLQTLPKLGALKLSGTQVTDAGLKQLPKLFWLEIDGTAVGDAGLAHLTSHTKLGYLRLSRTRVGDAGLAHLVGLLQLNELYLADTGVSDAGMAHLRGLTNMANLDLTGTKVTPLAVAELQKALPKCKIVAGPAGP